MSKIQVLDKRMTEKDVIEYGASIRTFDGSTYKVSGYECIHEVFNTKRYLPECYKDIRNVKNSEGVIVGKRKNAHTKLCFTSAAFEPVKKESSTYSRPKLQRRIAKPMRPKQKNSRVKKVSVLLQETGYADLNALKGVLLARGAKEVRFYRTKAGIAVVSHPDRILKDLISEKQ
ncbi:hypothetical protein EQZ20_24670 (plasmid) [Bacillus glycinifermentans]|uniref:Uncharacterized protein n=1 Tax=Bacillus glycinifermentans TaxID=1664069 RepID=A0AAJ4D536_9BACI|nr:hypothetical protein [Bacillus glycinifermentans]QAT68069.1 hypothetical protein EQZ20_24670 [Bacillus glycinifermentans]